MLRRIAAVVLAMHGMAHAVGFLGSFQLGEFAGQPVHTTVLFGRYDIGLTGAQVLGVGWLLLAIAFVGVGIATWLAVPRAMPALIVVTVVSLVLAVIEMPVSTIGVAVDVVIFGAVAVLRMVRQDLDDARAASAANRTTTLHGGTR